MSDKDSTDEEIIDILLPVADLRRENADLRADNERLKGVEIYLTEAVDALHEDVEHLNAELGEVTDLYTTYRGLVHDGVQVADVIKSLRGQLAALRISERAWTDQNERLRAALREIREMVDRQAEDEGLWFIHVTASEAYLQQELRSLHDRIERLASALI